MQRHFSFPTARELAEYARDHGRFAPIPLLSPAPVASNAPRLTPHAYSTQGREDIRRRALAARDADRAWRNPNA